MRIAKTIELDEPTERKLRVLSKRRRVEARLQQRACVVLLACEGWQNKDIAVQVGLDRRQVALWRQRFLDGGIEALRKDAPRSGRPATVTAEVQSRIVHATLHDRPVDATHWSTRTLAAKLGLGATTVRRVWRSNGLKPHLSRSFKLSRDPRFEDKLLDVVGLYLNPPEHALVLSCDEKSQIQALNRTQPGLPMKRGRAGTATHDYKRHGTTTLFAALNTLDGSVISMCQPRHRHDEWLKFLRLIERKTQAPGAAPDRGQLRHAQPPRRAGLAGQAPALRHALHPHQRVLAEHGRAVLSRHHRQAHPARQLHQRGGTGTGDRSVRRPPQHRSETLHLDRHCVGHPGEGHAGESCARCGCWISTEQSGALH